MFKRLMNKLNRLSLLPLQLSTVFNRLKKKLDQLNFKKMYKLQVQPVEGKVEPIELQ